MGVASMLSHFGWSLAWALGTSAGLAMGLRLAGHRARAPDLAVAATLLFPVFLALRPFPDPSSLDCATAPVPQMQIFGFLVRVRELAANGAPLAAWATDATLVTTVMNVVLFVPFGLALAWRGASWPVAAASAVALTLGIELAQLTGLFGAYPCAYRTFDVDDIWLNLSGVLAGFALARGLAGGPGRDV